MNIAPYAVVFLIGFFVGVYVANLKFRAKVNAGLRQMAKKASKINVEKGIK